MQVTTSEAADNVVPLRPHRWSVPKLWPNERCFIICGGASVDKKLVTRIRGRIIAVKHAALLRPDADVLFYAGRDSLAECLDIIRGFRGMVVSRGDYPGTPAGVHCVSKTDFPEQRGRLSTDPRILAGWDSGGAALNLAYLFGCNPIVLVGMDMRGGHWFRKHPKWLTNKSTHDRHREAVQGMGADLRELGVKVFDTSMAGRLRCFEKRPLSEFI